MFKLLLLIFVVCVVCNGDATPVNNKLPKGGRQKRLLFYDEEGNLVKTYKNPYLPNFALDADSNPFLRNFFNPFTKLMRPSYNSAIAYMIPVSEEVIQQISRDPMYQNRVLTLQKKELVVEPNTQCAGKRTQLMTKSCRNFLNCWDGWGFEQECPEGLVFSRDGYCDYPHNVDCSSRTNEPSKPMEPASPALVQIPGVQPAIPEVQPAGPEIPPAAPVQPSAPVMQPVVPELQPAATAKPQDSMRCDKDYEAFRSTSQCAEFFVCVDKVPIRFKCPADLYFNQDLGVCDYAYKVSCNDSVIIQAAEIVVQTRPVPCVGEPGDPPKVTPGIASPPQPKSASSSFESQSWISHVAISRQDAIHQLQLGNNKI